MTTLREHQFERWYKLTHWMSPELTKRDDGSYVHHVVQSMYIAYLAGYNRSAKDRKEELRKHTSPPQRKPRHVSYVCPQCYWSLDERKPLTEEEMMDEFCKTPGIHQFVSAFFAGARYAERAHGIT